MKPFTATVRNGKITCDQCGYALASGHPSAWKRMDRHIEGHQQKMSEPTDRFK